VGFLPSATTLLVLLATHAWAGIISTDWLLIGAAKLAVSDPFHDVGWRSCLAKLLRHECHVWIDVFEETLIALAKIIQAFLSIWRAEEAMFGAFTIASKTIVAFAAVSRQHIALVVAELPLLRRVDQSAQWILDNVAELVLRVDEVIARIEIAVVLNRQRRTASLAENAMSLKQPIAS
jgi:hypothetical protein